MTIKIHRGIHQIGGCVTECEYEGWHQVRTDDAEWISEDNVVFLTKQEARNLKIKATLSHKNISIQHGADGDMWCYKHDISNL